MREIFRNMEQEREEDEEEEEEGGEDEEGMEEEGGGREMKWSGDKKEPQIDFMKSFP